MTQFTSKQQDAISRIAIDLHVLLLQQWHHNPKQTTAKNTANNTNYYTRFIIFLFKLSNSFRLLMYAYGACVMFFAIFSIVRFLICYPITIRMT